MSSSRTPVKQGAPVQAGHEGAADAGQARGADLVDEVVVEGGAPVGVRVGGAGGQPVPGGQPARIIGWRVAADVKEGQYQVEAGQPFAGEHVGDAAARQGAA